MYSIDPTLLIAPCGMNCSICLAYLRERNRCHGCRNSHVNKPKTRVHCRIKTCEHLNSEFCYTCGIYPCDRLKHLDKRYRTKYRMSMIENLEFIKNHGMNDFLQTEKERWNCAGCGGTICVHKGFCLNCNQNP